METGSQKECIRYFKNNDGFRRFFAELRRKWKKYGRGAGVVTLQHPTTAEREALGRFLGKSFYADELRVRVSDFECALSETKFSGVTLQMLLETYFQEVMEKNQSVRQRKHQEQVDFFISLIQSADENVAMWLQNALKEHNRGYLLLKSMYEETPEELRKMVGHIDQLDRMIADEKGRTLRLAVVSAQISGNPHWFDTSMPAGKLLISFLSFLQHQEEPRNAEWRLELYFKCGIRPDDMSSFTFLYGIHLHLQTGAHPAYEGFIACHEPYVVTLLNLTNIVRASCSENDVYVVENQTVFSDLCDCASCSDTAVMCTSGQVRTASLVVLDLLASAGYTIHYGGDLDPEGMWIADRLISRHPEAVMPWHMGPEDYMAGMSEEVISESRLKQLDHIQNDALRQVVPLLRTYKKAGYQELLLDKLKTDIHIQKN